MHVRLVIIAVGMMSANAFAAEPHKAPERSPAQLQPASPSLVLAAVDPVRTAAPADPSATAPLKRPRVGRVTTCRCGDPQPSDADADQNQ